MFGLEDRHINFIKDTLLTFFPTSGTKCYIFGSRAKGREKKYSDVDIAIDDGGTPIDIMVLSKLISTFEDSSFPYKVDILDLNDTSEKFKNLINEDLVEFHLK